MVNGEGKGKRSVGLHEAKILYYLEGDGDHLQSVLTQTQKNFAL